MKKNNQGQSTVEFSLTLILLLAFSLFYIHLAMLFAYGNYVHYATFMSARAYLSSGQNPDDQKARARSVIVHMLMRSAAQSGTDRYPFIAKGEGGGNPKGLAFNGDNFDPNNMNLSWLQGVRYTFRSRLFIIPLSGLSTKLDASVNTLTLTSESWLGREQTVDECMSDMAKLGYIDNGC